MSQRKIPIAPNHNSSLKAAAVTPWLAIVGIGEDGVEGLTARAQTLIKTAELVIGGQRHLQLAAPLIQTETLAWCSPIAETIPLLLTRRGRNVAVLASGDPFCFGIGTLLAEHIAPAEMTVIPQPSCIALATARLGWTQQVLTTVSLCGRPLPSLRPHLQPDTRLLLLSADASTPSAVAAYLTKLGFGPSKLHLLEALGGPDEKHRFSTAADFEFSDINPLNLLALEVIADPDARALPLLCGRPDDWFEHDGQISKAEIRALSLASLNPRPGALLWDIGCGSGAVSIEWLLASPSAQAIAIDQHPERLARAARNAVALGVPQLEFRHGKAPAILAQLPPPQAVFLGGGASDPELLASVWAALSSGGCLVANAVTLETQQLLSEAYLRWGGKLTRISIERAEPIGRFQGFRPAMPVLHYAVVKP